MHQKLSKRNSFSALHTPLWILLVESCTGAFSAFKFHLLLNGIFWLNFGVEELEFRRQPAESEEMDEAELSTAAR